MKTKRFTASLAMFLAILMAALIGISCLSTEADATDASTSNGAALTGTMYYSKAYQVYTLINSNRTANGLSTVTLDEELMEAAAVRAAEIATSFSHTRPDGTSCFTVLEDISYSAAGENIAMGYSSASSVMTGWMNSSGHKANILGSSYNAVGVGCFKYNGTTYWVQIFAKKSTLDSYSSGQWSDGTTSAYVSTNSSAADSCITYGYNGIIFDPTYYASKYSDLKAAFGSNYASLLNHFQTYGLSEGRQASASFHITSYRYQYSDLRNAYGSNWSSYCTHYILYGRTEGRAGTGCTSLQGYVTVYNGVDYSAVYDYNYYLSKNSDVKAAYGGDDTAVLKHFVTYGMSEGRLASSSFNVYAYRNRYSDLRSAYGSALKYYYLHYINYGISEGRTAV